jgi:putative ABC transport system permease protein
MSALWNDLRYALRTLPQRPGFTAVATLTLALGIGANRAIFTLVDATLLRKLPFPAPDRLVLIWGQSRQQDWSELPLSLPNFLDLRAQSHVFADVAAWVTDRVDLSGTDQPKQLQSALITASLFPVLDVRPSLGRTFRADEDLPGGPRTVILSDSLWRRRFGAAGDLVGKTIGLGAAWALTRLLSGLLFQVRATDPVVFAAVAVLLAVVAVAASVLPAWRALAVDPAVALRHS